MCNSDDCLSVIWTSDVDYDRDWKDWLEGFYPELTEYEREQLMYEMNDEYLEDERVNLNIDLGRKIIVICDIGRWNGRFSGYRLIPSGNIADCLSFGKDEESATWYIDKSGDMKCRASHHDGTNYYTYRVFRKDMTDDQIDDFLDRIYEGEVTSDDILRCTERLGDAVARVYGATIPDPE